jgi:hypothetical protein
MSTLRKLFPSGIQRRARERRGREWRGRNTPRSLPLSSFAVVLLQPKRAGYLLTKVDSHKGFGQLDAIERISPRLLGRNVV